MAFLLLAAVKGARAAKHAVNLQDERNAVISPIRNRAQGNPLSTLPDIDRAPDGEWWSDEPTQHHSLAAIPKERPLRARPSLDPVTEIPPAAAADRGVVSACVPSSEFLDVAPTPDPPENSIAFFRPLPLGGPAHPPPKTPTLSRGEAAQSLPNTAARSSTHQPTPRDTILLKRHSVPVTSRDLDQTSARLTSGENIRNTQAVRSKSRRESVQIVSSHAVDSDSHKRCQGDDLESETEELDKKHSVQCRVDDGSFSSSRNIGAPISTESGRMGKQKNAPQGSDDGSFNYATHLKGSSTKKVVTNASRPMSSIQRDKETLDTIAVDTPQISLKAPPNAVADPSTGARSQQAYVDDGSFNYERRKSARPTQANAQVAHGVARHGRFSKGECGSEESTTKSDSSHSQDETKPVEGAFAASSNDIQRPFGLESVQRSPGSSTSPVAVRRSGRITRMTVPGSFDEALAGKER